MPVNSPSAATSCRVLVTGATGFIGRRIVRAFLDRGWQVTAAVHKTPIPAWMVGAGVDSLKFTTDDLRPVADAISGAQAVCHAAAFLPPDYTDSDYVERCLEINAVFALRLAELAAKQPGIRFVHLSSAQAYDAQSEEPCEEHDRLYSADRATYYLTSKLAGEIFVEHQRRSRGLAAIGLRVGSCYGPGMSHKSVVSMFLDKARRGQTIEVHDGGQATCDHVFVDDVAKIAVLAAESGDPGMYNMGSGRKTSILELAHATAKTYPDNRVPIKVRPPSEHPANGFPALSMHKTNSTWNHRPTDLRAGLAAMRQCLDSDVDQRRAA